MDAFGLVMKQFHEHGDASEVVERSDGYVAVGDLSRYFARYEEWAELERPLMSRVVGRVLDIGCGAGRHSLYLQEQGFDVVATDSSSGCVAVSLDRGVTNAHVLSIERIGEVPNPPYDTVLLLGNNLGLLGSKARARRILTSLDSITSSSARILGTTSDYTQTSDPIHLTYHEYNRRRRRLPGTSRIRIRWHEYVGDWFDYVLFAEEDLIAVLTGTGWKIDEALSAPNGVHHGYVISKTVRA